MKKRGQVWMEINNYDQFEKFLGQAHPKYGETPDLPFIEDAPGL
jgi:hypothetical protein